jgi:hypothetical protein
MTRRLADAVKRIALSDVQQLPVTLKGHLGFHVMNVTRVIDCLDEERSEFIEWVEEDKRPDRLGGYRGVTRLHVEHAKIPADGHVFRVAGWLPAVVVSGDVKSAMEAVGCVGANFVDVT